MSNPTSETIPSPRPPLSIPTIDTEQFRRKLAGLEDPLGPRAGAAGRENLKQFASRLCSILAHLYGVNESDRTKLWEHIGKALVVADEKTSDDDIEHFISECLVSVQAEHGRAAACDALTQLTMEATTWPPEQRHDFLNYVRAHRFTVLTFGRARWEQVKKEEIEL